MKVQLSGLDELNTSWEKLVANDAHNDWSKGIRLGFAEMDSLLRNLNVRQRFRITLLRIRLLTQKDQAIIHYLRSELRRYTLNIMWRADGVNVKADKC